MAWGGAMLLPGAVWPGRLPMSEWRGFINLSACSTRRTKAQGGASWPIVMIVLGDRWNCLMQAGMGGHQSHWSGFAQKPTHVRAPAAPSEPFKWSTCKGLLVWGSRSTTCRLAAHKALFMLNITGIKNHIKGRIIGRLSISCSVHVTS